MLAVVIERYRVPLMRTFLDHSGNSTTQQRIALMQRYLALFKASSVRIFLADRKFIGQEWFKFLKDKGIPFAIRVKEKQLVMVERREYSLRSYWICRAARESAVSQQLFRQRLASLLLSCILAPSASRGASC